ncbi:hypothetical protein AB1M95_03210 [Sulfitobacter sp. LCG007]
MSEEPRPGWRDAILPRLAKLDVHRPALLMQQHAIRMNRHAAGISGTDATA